MNPSAGHNTSSRPDLAEPVVLQQALDELAGIFYIIKPDGDLYWWNTRLSEVTGYSNEQLAEMHAVEFVPEAERDRIVTAIDTALESGQTTIETHLVAADGKTHPYEVTATRLTRPNDELIGLVGTGRDVSDRQSMQRELSDTQSQLQAAVDAGAVGTWHWLLDTDTIIAGPGFANIFGFDPDTVQNGLSSEKVTATIHDDDHDRVQTAIRTAIDNCGSFEEKYRVKTLSGDTRWVINRGSVECDDSQTPYHVLGALTDITEQKRYEQQLERQRDDLELLNQVLRHDIRNELQVVAAYADQLTEEFESDTDAAEYATTIADGADRAIKLTETARDMASVMLTVEENIQTVSLRRIVESEIANVRSSYPDAILTVPDPIPEVTVQANEMLQSVLRNLLTNAIQHNDADIPEVTITTTLDNEHVRLRIADNGPGIPDDRKESVFGRGEKGLDSPGAGIGLYLVQTLVTAYDGTLWIEDNEPRGTVFVVELNRC